MKMILVPADVHEEASIIEVEKPYPDLKEKWLEGGWVERVSTPIMLTMSPDTRLIMFVDEEGRLKDLPYNSRASLFYGGIIAGPAIFCAEGLVHGPEGPDIDAMPLPDDFGIDSLIDVGTRLKFWDRVTPLRYTPTSA